MPPRDFRTLTPQEVLLLGIAVEEANGERLRTFATLFADYAPAAAGVLSQMASEEDQHRCQLEAMYQQRYGMLQQRLGEEEIREVIEAYDLDEAENLVFDSFSPRGALETILAAERQAQAFYRRAVESAVEPELRALYQELAGFEDLHLKWAEERLAALGDSA